MELLEKSVIKLEGHGNELSISSTICNGESIKIVDNEIYNYLIECKNKIDKIGNIKKWDYYKKLTNPYELVNKYIKSKKLNLGIADYAPLSRAFFKFWEILIEYNLIDNKIKSLTYGALAEGPGGFIEAFSFYRRKYGGYNNDSIICITLRSDSDNIPDWEVIRGCKYNISWGEDGTGNLYKVKNILHYSTHFENNKADLVSADGGFDFSNNYYKVEQNIQQLLFCEIVTGLIILKFGGHMVVKMFDSFNKSTVDILYILSAYFKELYIVKPYTSRPANNEKYLVCKYFKGIKKKSRNALLDIVNIMDTNNKGNYIGRFLTNTIPIDFLNIINAYNVYSIKLQIYYILKSILYIETKLNNHSINKIIKHQSVYGILWCHKYNFNINKKSRFLNNKIQYYFMPYFKKSN